MDTGHVISGVAHLGLIGWALLGGVFRSEPLPFDVTEVAVISSAEYDALFGGEPTPVALPVEPEPTPEPEAPPPDVSLDAPEAPDIEPAPSVALPDVNLSPPDPDAPPAPRQVDRIAPEPVAPPPPDADTAPVAQDAVTPDPAADQPQDEQEAEVPEEATTEIVTEAERPSGTLTASLRPPQVRRPTPAPEEPEEAAQPVPEETPQTPQDDVTAALTEALAGAEGPNETPAGPPMSAGEKDALRVAVSACWNVGSLSTEALATTVVVGVSMSEAGKPVAGSIRLLSSEGGSEVAARQAYEAARRAILRCQKDGYPLPREKYASWKDIEMTFNPERMRIK